MVGNPERIRAKLLNKSDAQPLRKLHSTTLTDESEFVDSYESEPLLQEDSIDNEPMLA
jgi:hypothetical protein